MKTVINDRFPLSKLECQFGDICKSFRRTHCRYDTNCPYGLIHQIDDKNYNFISFRQLFRKYSDPYLVDINLQDQIEIILGNDN